MYWRLDGRTKGGLWGEEQLCRGVGTLCLALSLEIGVVSMRMEWNSGIESVWGVWRVKEVRDSGIGIDYAR